MAGMVDTFPLSLNNRNWKFWAWKEGRKKPLTTKIVFTQHKPPILRCSSQKEQCYRQLDLTPYVPAHLRTITVVTVEGAHFKAITCAHRWSDCKRPRVSDSSCCTDFLVFQVFLFDFLEIFDIGVFLFRRGDPTCRSGKAASLVLDDSHSDVSLAESSDRLLLLEEEEDLDRALAGKKLSDDENISKDDQPAQALMEGGQRRLQMKSPNWSLACCIWALFASRSAITIGAPRPCWEAPGLVPWFRLTAGSRPWFEFAQCKFRDITTFMKNANISPSQKNVRPFSVLGETLPPVEGQAGYLHSVRSNAKHSIREQVWNGTSRAW